MQAFKLVNGGFVDRVIVFDALPDYLMKGIKTREVSGFPRAWAKWLISIGSLRDVFKTETSLTPDPGFNVADGRWYFKYTPIGKEPCFFVLEYTDVNADKDAWRAISEYVRMNVGPEIRLREKLEDMAVALAAKPTDELIIEPEDIPVIPLPKEQGKILETPVIKADEKILVSLPPIIKRRRGRPRTVGVGL